MLDLPGSSTIMRKRLSRLVAAVAVSAIVPSAAVAADEGWAALRVPVTFWTPSMNRAAALFRTRTAMWVHVLSKNLPATLFVLSMSITEVPAELYCWNLMRLAVPGYRQTP